MRPPLPPMKSWPARLCQRFPGLFLRAIEKGTQGRLILALAQPLRMHTRLNLASLALEFGMLLACLWAIQDLPFPGDVLAMLALLGVALVQAAGAALGLRRALASTPHQKALLQALRADPIAWQQAPDVLRTLSLRPCTWVAELACLGFLPEGQARLRGRRLDAAMAPGTTRATTEDSRPRL